MSVGDVDRFPFRAASVGVRVVGDLVFESFLRLFSVCFGVFVGAVSIRVVWDVFSEFWFRGSVWCRWISPSCREFVV